MKGVDAHARPDQPTSDPRTECTRLHLGRLLTGVETMGPDTDMDAIDASMAGTNEADVWGAATGDTVADILLTRRSRVVVTRFASEIIIFDPKLFWQGHRGNANERRDADNDDVKRIRCGWRNAEVYESCGKQVVGRLEALLLSFVFSQRTAVLSLL